MSDIAVNILPFCLDAAGTTPAAAARLVLTGEGGGDWVVSLDGAEHAAPAVTITMDVVDYCRVVAERARARRVRRDAGRRRSARSDRARLRERTRDAVPPAFSPILQGHRPRYRRQNEASAADDEAARGVAGAGRAPGLGVRVLADRLAVDLGELDLAQPAVLHQREQRAAPVGLGENVARVRAPRSRYATSAPSREHDVRAGGAARPAGAAADLGRSGHASAAP